MRDATIRERIYAFIIDYVFWMIVAIFMIKILKYNGLDEDRIIAAVSPISFWILFKDFFGQGIGKRIIGLRIVYKYNINKVPNYFLLLLRNIPLIIWFVDLFILFKFNERLGDRLLKTNVIRIGYS